jgi:hypothetical protein
MYLDWLPIYGVNLTSCGFSKELGLVALGEAYPPFKI